MRYFKRVICISPPVFDVITNTERNPGIVTAENYVTTGVEIINGKYYYALHNFPKDVFFSVDAFLECSELDETLLINHPINKRKS